MHVKYVDAQSLHVELVWKLGEWDAAFIICLRFKIARSIDPSPITSMSRIIGKLEEGRSVTSVAAEFRTQHRFTTLETISNDRNSYLGVHSGRTRNHTADFVLYIWTTDNRGHAVVVCLRHPVRCVTPAHRRRRSLW
ncbi:hypothetical protein TNCV_1201981 [Trichonephila clavipes]|nr:hypothetical protein TNCV_1201981 [Trichonephila clavipes]